MRVGFTGTRKGLTMYQSRKVSNLLELLGDELGSEFHHGDCTGSDMEAHIIALHNLKAPNVIIHPPSNDKHRAYSHVYAKHHNTEVRRTKPYLDRNIDIVNESELMIATPGEDHEVRRSGTWATIRYTRRRKIPLVIIYPCGKVNVTL